jgi:hypothetical protein
VNCAASKMGDPTFIPFYRRRHAGYFAQMSSEHLKIEEINIKKTDWKPQHLYQSIFLSPLFVVSTINHSQLLFPSTLQQVLNFFALIRQPSVCIAD